MKLLFNVSVTDKKWKEDTWYLHTKSLLRMIHYLSLKITLNLNRHIADNETRDGNF